MQTSVHEVEEERVREQEKNKVPAEYHSVSVMAIILTREGEGEGDECEICRITLFWFHCKGYYTLLTQHRFSMDT